jgi:gas vesicle protein
MPVALRAEVCDEISERKGEVMNGIEGKSLAFLIGVGIGVGVALFYAPQSGEETREWISDNAEHGWKTLRRTGRRSMRQLQHTVGKGEEALTDLVRGGKEALEDVAAKLT